jgi:hypothetical protein
MKVSITSDTIILSSAYNKFHDGDVSHNPFHIVFYTTKVSEILIKKGLLFRGVINYGLLYHDQTNRIIVGSALNECFELEKTNVIYPRIVATDSFINKIKKIHSKAFYNIITNEETLRMIDLFYKDFDGQYCYNWIQDLIADYKDIKDKDVKELEKYFKVFKKRISKNNPNKINMKLEYLSNLFDKHYKNDVLSQP